jgi:hypothetical protein
VEVDIQPNEYGSTVTIEHAYLVSDDYDYISGRFKSIYQFEVSPVASVVGYYLHRNVFWVFLKAIWS